MIPTAPAICQIIRPDPRVLRTHWTRLSIAIAHKRRDIRAAAWNIADDWTNFERSIENQTGFKLGNCSRDRFKKNGKVECVKEYDCKTKDGVQQCKLGHGWGLGQKIKIYQTFLDKMASSSMSQADRRACYAGLMTHEFAQYLRTLCRARTGGARGCSCSLLEGAISGNQ